LFNFTLTLTVIIILKFSISLNFLSVASKIDLRTIVTQTILTGILVYPLPAKSTSEILLHKLLNRQ